MKQFHRGGSLPKINREPTSKLPDTVKLDDKPNDTFLWKNKGITGANTEDFPRGKGGKILTKKSYGLIPVCSSLANNSIGRELLGISLN